MPSTFWIGTAAAALVTVSLVWAPMAAGHTNHVEADPQVVADDRVRIEAAFPAVEGWLVVHETNASGGVGDPVGHVALDPDDGFRTDVPVPIRGNATANRSLVAALHHEDGGSGFDPDDDPVVTSFGEPVTSSFRASHGPTPVYVGAEAFGAVPVRDGAVRVRSLSLADDGFVVVRRNGDGAVLGDARRDAGTHANVSVAVDAGDLPTGERIRVRATVHVDDGDGRYGPADPPVDVGGEPVSTTFFVERPDSTGTGGDGDSGFRLPGPGIGLTAVAVGLLAACRRADRCRDR